MASAAVTEEKATEIKERVASILKELKEGLPFNPFARTSDAVKYPYYDVPEYTPPFLLLYGCCLEVPPQVYYLSYYGARFIFRQRPALFGTLIQYFLRVYPDAANLYVPDFHEWAHDMQVSFLEQLDAVRPPSLRIIFLAEDTQQLEPLALKLAGHAFYRGLPPQNYLWQLISTHFADAPFVESRQQLNLAGYRVSDVRAMIEMGEKLREQLLRDPEEAKSLLFRWVAPEEEKAETWAAGRKLDELSNWDPVVPYFQAVLSGGEKDDKKGPYFNYDALLSQYKLDTGRENIETIPRDTLSKVAYPPPLTMPLFRERVYEEQLSTMTAAQLERYLRFAKMMGKKADIRQVQEELASRGVEVRETIYPSKPTPLTVIGGEESGFGGGEPRGNTAVQLTEEMYDSLNQGRPKLEALKPFMRDQTLLEHLNKILERISSWEEQVKLKFDIVPGQEGNPDADPVPLLKTLDPGIRSMVEEQVQGYRALYAYLADRKDLPIQHVEDAELLMNMAIYVRDSVIPQLKAYLMMTWNVKEEGEEREEEKEEEEEEKRRPRPQLGLERKKTLFAPTTTPLGKGIELD